MLPWPLCPLAGHAIFGQNVVVGSMWVSSEGRWGTYQEEYAWTLIFFASEPYHGLVWSYHLVYNDGKFRFLCVESEDLKKAIYQLRYQIYVEEFGFFSPEEHPMVSRQINTILTPSM